MNKNVSLAIEKAVGTISQKTNMIKRITVLRNQIYFLYRVKQSYFKMREALQLRLIDLETLILLILVKLHLKTDT